MIPQPIIDRCDSNLRETMQQLLQFTPPRDAGDPSSPIRLLADRLGRQTGLALTESFLTVIALSIRAEASLQRTSLQRAALSIEGHMATSHPVDRFYFEDCKWRARPATNCGRPWDLTRRISTMAWGAKPPNQCTRWHGDRAPGASEHVHPVLVSHAPGAPHTCTRCT